MFNSERFFSRGGLRQKHHLFAKNAKFGSFEFKNQTCSIHCKKINFYNVWTEMAIVWMSVEQQMVATVKCLGCV